MSYIREVRPNRPHRNLFTMSTDSFFEHDGIAFHYRDAGEGVPLVFQHGLGSEIDTIFGMVKPPEGSGSSGSTPEGMVRPGRSDRFRRSRSLRLADDLAFFLDHLGIARAIIGGVSMGAAISLRFSMLHPAHTLGLILSRPAWLDFPYPPNLAIFPLLARFVREFGVVEGRTRLLASEEYAEIARESPDAGEVLAGQFSHPRFAETFEKFEAIPASSPSLAARDSPRSPSRP